MNLDRILITIGISSSMAGFNYIEQAVNFLREQQIRTNITTIYEEIKKKNEYIAKTGIERGIRYAIMKAYPKNEIFQKIYFSKPSNVDFLYDLAFHQNVFEEIILEELENKAKNINTEYINPSKFLNTERG